MTIPDLKKRIKEASEPTIELLQKALDTCQERNKSFEALMDDIGGLHKTVWLTFQKDNPNVQAAEVEGEAEFIDSKEVVEANFYVVRNTNSTHSAHLMYPILDADLKIVGTPLDYDGLTRSDASNLALTFNETLDRLDKRPKNPIVGKAAGGILDHYFSTVGGSTAGKPKPYAQPGEDVFCRTRRQIEPDHAGKWDAWQSFGAGFEDFEAYAAKLYAIFFGVDTSRQALVTRSEGKTGKSCATAALASIIDNKEVAMVITGTHVSQSSRFLASNYVDAAFIYAPDCNVKTFLLSEVVKQLTGSDMVLYENKGGAYGQFDPAGKKLMVNMNPRPLVLKEEHSRSRILYLEQQQASYSDIGNAAYTQLLKDQLPGFLAFGERSFADRWRNQVVVLNDRAQRTFDALVGSERQDFYDFVARHLVLADCENADLQSQLMLSSDDLSALFNKHKVTSFDRDLWREWLEDLEGVTRVKESTRGVRTYAGIATKAKAAQVARLDADKAVKSAMGGL